MDRGRLRAILTAHHEPMDSSSTQPFEHSGRAQHAAHPGWAFRRESAIWAGDEPWTPNMTAVASEMSEWLSGTLPFMSVSSEAERNTLGSYTNPYTYHASSLGAAFAAALDDAHAFVTSEEDLDPMHAEVTRIRLHSELVLYAARFCEAAIKQMLHCTQIPRRLYKRAAMGQLLAIGCDACRKAGAGQHDISLLGALAHRYFLCHILDGCVFEHLQLVGHRRNVEAAHSEALALNPRSASASRRDMLEVMDEVGHLFKHMVEHIAQIERPMLDEIWLYIKHRPHMPPADAFARIPARPPQLAIDAARAAAKSRPADVAPESGAT